MTGAFSYLFNDMKHASPGTGMSIGTSPGQGAYFEVSIDHVRNTGLYQYDATLTVYNADGNVLSTSGPYPASADPDSRQVGSDAVNSGLKTIADGNYTGTVKMGLYRYQAADKYWAINIGTVLTVSGGSMDGVWLHAGYLNSGTGSAGCITIRYTSYNTFISNLWPNAKGTISVHH